MKILKDKISVLNKQRWRRERGGRGKGQYCHFLVKIEKLLSALGGTKELPPSRIHAGFITDRASYPT